MGKILRPLDALFNRIFSSHYNPLYRSGTIAVGLLTLVMATGLYLVFFYRLGEPYESILNLQNSIWLGRWVRSLHRYASDAMVVAVLVHVVRMFVQGKAWGPRTLAWITGVGLMVFMLVSGWTGYVMVWDTHGQAVAVAGAKIMDSLGFFSDPIGRSFDGSNAPPASFFFLNLFLHIVIPLAMIFGLWLHTSKMANAVWFPHKALLQGICGVLLVVSIGWPAPLGDKADLLKDPQIYPTDWFFSFWLPWAERAPLGTFLVISFVVLILATIPWWLKPSAAKRPRKSFNEEAKCQGCTQCVQDCPYEAISMVNRTLGTGSPQVARVNPELCVACGLCAASCAPFTMGPFGRKGLDQFTAARQFVAATKAKSADPKQKLLIMGCNLQGGVFDRIRKFTLTTPEFEAYPVACVGTVHVAAIDQLARNFSAVAIVACPERNCTNKDGHRLVTERLSGVREPTFEHAAQKKNVHLFSAGDGEERELFRRLRALSRPQVAKPEGDRWLPVRAAAVGIALVAAIAGLTRLPYGRASQNGSLRLSFRLSGQSIKTCQTRSAQELSALPQHMRTAELCTYKMLSYRLRLRVDDQLLLDEETHPGGLHSDRPLYINRDLSLEPGPHSVTVTFDPLDDTSASAISLKLEEKLHIKNGRIVLIQLAPDQKSLVIKGGEE